MPPAALRQGIEQFNQQEFYACHDTLEALWIDAPEPERRFYQGILQIAVGCYHLSNQNWRGAVLSLGEGCQRLSDYAPAHAGVNVDRLLDASVELLERLHADAPVGTDAVVRQFSMPGDVALPRIVCVEEAAS
ncbi:hypothetical protein KR51_00021050 [Rubidibacter lacunae KORDI 51-2]|uniref:DUF309 domain-containing protein n=1 Tax=Rubidibacter lacunae KORDI 51-2 TaxID=582515 RepID=U5DL54_9CHRO|nr:hypothetical protein KR51_00021050 [Rubidibacter lacunae KORDI 51-2]